MSSQHHPPPGGGNSKVCLVQFGHPSSVCIVTGAAWHPTRPGRGQTSWSTLMLGNDASSACQIALGSVRGRRGPGRLLLLPCAPCSTTGDLLCSCSECRFQECHQEAVWQIALEGSGCGLFISRETCDLLGLHHLKKGSSGDLLVASAGV